MSRSPVLVSVVTRNDARYLEACLRSVLNQSVPVRVKVFDNASRDSTREIAGKARVELRASRRNTGYSHGHNANLRGESFDTALLLNADVVLEPDYLERVQEAFSQVEGAGMVGGRLIRMDREGRPVVREGCPVLDSTGIFFTPSQRHFDRGGGQLDRGQYSRRELVFGITGAALACRREMLEDVACNGEYLDEEFFAYREDADLAWRCQLRGWKAVYEPRARGMHARRVVPSRRRQLPAAINYHSLKNRYLMRIKNMDGAVRLRCFPYMWCRDLGILAYVLLLERRSLGAYAEVWRLRKRFRSKRRRIQGARRVPPLLMASWFSFDPTSFPLPDPAAPRPKGMRYNLSEPAEQSHQGTEEETDG